MSGSYSGKVVLKFSATGTGSSTLSSVVDAIDQDYTHSFSSGTGASQFSNLYRAQTTIAASGTLNLDLSGSLTNAFGSTITGTALKAILIRAATANTNDVLVGGGSTTVPLFSDVSAMSDAATSVSIRVKPGGTLFIDAPALAGYTITAVSADVLTLKNSSSGTGVTFDIFIAVVD